MVPPSVFLQVALETARQRCATIEAAVEALASGWSSNHDRDLLADESVGRVRAATVRCPVALAAGAVAAAVAGSVAKDVCTWAWETCTRSSRAAATPGWWTAPWVMSGRWPQRLWRLSISSRTDDGAPVITKVPASVPNLTQVPAFGFFWNHIPDSVRTTARKRTSPRWPAR